MDNIDDPLNFHKCRKCSYKTRFLRRILIHVRWHRRRSKDHRFICYLHSPEMYQCGECQFQSHHKVLLTNHFNTIHKREAAKNEVIPVLRYCEKCDFQTYSSLVLLNHQNCCDGIENHILQSSQTENNCQREEEKKHRKLRKHQHTKLKKIKCSHCTYRARYKSELKNHHIHIHTPPDQINWLKCKHCSYKSKWQSSLNHHNRTQHVPASEVEKIMRFKCNHCSSKFKTHQHLKYHVFRKHTPEEEIIWIKCEHCSFKAREKRSLRQHLLIKHAKPTGSYSTFEWSILNPVPLKHAASNQGKWLQCGHCSYKTIWNSTLNRHTRSKHAQPSKIEKLKPFECNHCSYKATAKSLMKTHVLWKHTSDEEINWFRCARCPYKAKRKYALRLHLLRQHSKPA